MHLFKANFILNLKRYTAYLWRCRQADRFVLTSSGGVLVSMPIECQCFLNEQTLYSCHMSKCPLIKMVKSFFLSFTFDFYWNPMCSPVRVATLLRHITSQISVWKHTLRWPFATSESCLASSRMTIWFVWHSVIILIQHNVTRVSLDLTATAA